MEELQKKKGFLCDMDGVIYHGNHLLPGAKKLVNWFHKEKKSYLFLTNSSERSRKELQQKLYRLGLEVGEEHFYTSALATAGFLASQSIRKPTPGESAQEVSNQGTSAYVIGEAGLINALYEVGITMNDINPDYVVVGESKSYNLSTLEKAVNLVLGGARLIGTNPDLTGPIEGGITPATGALIAPIEMATGSKAYFVGKPNPIMMRQGLKRLGTRREETAIIGDRMDTDIISGIESGIETVLVLSGVTNHSNMKKFAYRPDYILEGVGNIPS